MMVVMDGKQKMRMIPIRVLAVCLAAAGLTACAPTAPTRQAPQDAAVQCQVPTTGETLIGNWLSVASERGVAGAVRTLYTLNPDGTMVYVQQIKRPNSPSQGLHESGCWQRQGATLVLRTVLSNGSPVNLDDPIYTNHYEVVRADASGLRMRDGARLIDARRMSPGYRLPF